ncbi:ninjurin-1-like [Neoarius graeffei]|uniref:ninjurin-1-like n=1 Tax=Neoarius graeffei TaxID=443677 RepID=UPI00298BD519|nr:ninjurin-1-like [Neoarius graeffei]
MASATPVANADANRLTGGGQTQTPEDVNSFAQKKSAAMSMLDVALLMANASQLKAVLEEDSSFSFYIPLITLISISLILQVVVGILLVFVVKCTLRSEWQQDQMKKLTNMSTVCVLIIVIVNVLITAFGVQRPRRSI